MFMILNMCTFYVDLKKQFENTICHQMGYKHACLFVYKHSEATHLSNINGLRVKVKLMKSLF